VSKTEARRLLGIARGHLDRVLTAWDTPTDWSDLTIYGFYCLEAAVVAAGKQFDWEIRKTHADKADAAQRLHDQHGVPDVSQLLVALNEARKATAYGDAQRPDLDPEEVASEIEEFVDSIERLIEGR